MNREQLNIAAFAAAKTLLQLSVDVAQTVVDAYRSGCRQADRELRVKGLAEPTAITIHERLRISFEIVMFAAFIVMFYEAERHLRRRSFLSSSPDAEAIR